MESATGSLFWQEKERIDSDNSRRGNFFIVVGLEEVKKFALMVKTFFWQSGKVKINLSFLMVKNYLIYKVWHFLIPQNILRLYVEQMHLMP